MPNRHCSVVEIGGIGVMIEGPSGAGKSSVALGLLDIASARGLGAALVSDDQALIETRDGMVVAHAPASIAGLAEQRGFGIISIPHREKTQIGLVARIVDDEAIDRIPEQQFEVFDDVEVRRVEIPRRHESAAIRIILACLESMRQRPS